MKVRMILEEDKSYLQLNPESATEDELLKLAVGSKTTAKLERLPHPNTQKAMILSIEITKQP